MHTRQHGRRGEGEGGDLGQGALVLWLRWKKCMALTCMLCVRVPFALFIQRHLVVRGIYAPVVLGGHVRVFFAHSIYFASCFWCQTVFRTGRNALSLPRPRGVEEHLP